MFQALGRRGGNAAVSAAASRLCRERSFATAAAAAALTGEERAGALARLGGGGMGWQSVQDRDAITKTYNFIDFKQAWDFMSKTAVLAEEMNHHPEWFNVYNRVEITLTTHDCGGLSTNDVEMAEKMDEFAAQLNMRGTL